MVSRLGVIFEHRSGAYLKYVSTGAQKIAPRRPPERLLEQSLGLYLEDLTPGMVFTSTTQALDEAAMKRFAGAFDPQPFHLDEAAAEKTIFGGLAASGWHIASVSMKLLVESLPLANGIIGAGVELAWPKPVRPGDVLQVVTEVLEVTPSRTKPDRGMGVIRSETRNQHGEVVQLLTSRLVLFRRPV